MFCKLKTIATIFTEKNELKEGEQLKTVKLQVGGGTTVRQLVAEALKKANLDSSFECVGVKYSSKKFGRFLAVDYDQKVKGGREYKIKVIEVVPNIEDMKSSKEEKQMDVKNATLSKAVLVCEKSEQVINEVNKAVGTALEVQSPTPSIEKKKKKKKKKGSWFFPYSTKHLVKPRVPRRM